MGVIMNQTTYKIGTYATKAEAQSALSGASRAAGRLPGKYSLDISQSSRGWVVNIGGSNDDVQAFKKVWR
jgi:hypothetical protein